MGECGGAIVTLWRRQNELFLARADGTAEERFVEGKNAGVTLREKGMYAVWSSSEGIMVSAPGRQPWVLSKSGGFAVIAPAGPVIVAWEDDGRIRTARLD